MKFWNLNVKRGADGSKHLDVQIHGVIDGGWYDDAGVDTAACIAELNQHLDAKTIGVRINSVGGSAFGGVAMYNALESHSAEVTCTVEGLAASAASLVAMAGKTCMGIGSMMMIHSPSTVAMGNAAELRRTADFLDKVQDSLAAIYTKKTGKSLDDVNDLLDDETWMTADEAVAGGFADSVGVDGESEGEADPNVDKEPKDDEPDGDDDPEMLGDAVTWRGVQFPMAKVPQQILAMAKKPAPAANGGGGGGGGGILALVPQPSPQSPITRAELALRAPDLLAALVKEGHDAGATAERARLQAIDDLGLKGCDEMVVAAKYGDKPMDARDLAVAAIKSGQQAGAEMLAARRAESRVLTGVVPSAPDQTAAAAQARFIQAIVDGGNAVRGGKTK